MSRKIGDKDVWVRNFDVSQPTKHKKGFTVYKVVSTVFPKGFPDGATKITVWKRYNDFKKLHRELELVFKHLYLKGEFPKLPRERLFGRFDEGIIEERRRASLALLTFAASFPQLFTNKIFVKFFETGYLSQDLEGGDGGFSSSDNHPQQDSAEGVTVEDDVLLNCECLVPQKVWTESRNGSPSHQKPAGDDGSHSDVHSLSSFTSSSPEHLPSIPSNDLLRDEPIPSGTLPNHSTPAQSNAVASQLPSVKTYSDSSSSVISSAQLNGELRPHGSCSPREPQSAKPTPYTLQENGRSRFSGGGFLVPSASLTEDLDTILEDVIGPSEATSGREEAAASGSSSHNSLPFNLPSSISCLSLDTLTARKVFKMPSSGSKDKQSGYGKKLLHNGFGLFDFLPIFAKEKKEEIPSPSLAESLSTPYICEAAGHFTVAHHYESNGEFLSALGAYSEGIQVLLEGAKGDRDAKRKVLVRKKLEKYISQAECVKQQMAVERSEVGGAGDASFNSPARRLQNLMVKTQLCREEGFVVVDSNVLPSSVEELKKYKVVGCTFHNLLVVVDTTETDIGPKCYAIKVLRKSAVPLDPEKPTLIPSTVPFMVELIKWCNTEDAIILVLQYAGGGRLINFVESYQTKQISAVVPPVDEEEKCQSRSRSPAAFSSTRNTAGDGETRLMQEVPEVNERISIVEESEDVEVSGMETNETAACADAVCESDDILVNADSEEDKVWPTCAAAPPSPLVLDVETNELLENSRVLLQTVSRALQEQKKSLLLPKDDREVSQVKKEEAASLQASVSVPTLHPITSSPCESAGVAEESEEGVVLKRMVPVSCVKVWAAELVLALEKLHTQGITFGDMDINNILLGDNGHILLTYRALWNEVDTTPGWNDFCAPEVRSSWGKSLWKIHPSADWWSLGAILFLLITGQTLGDLHPEGIHQQTVIIVPSVNICGESLASTSRTLLVELLQFNPATRLGYYGAEEIKSHPFFEGLDWDSLASSTLEE